MFTRFKRRWFGYGFVFGLHTAVRKCLGGPRRAASRQQDAPLRKEMARLLRAVRRRIEKDL